MTIEWEDRSTCSTSFSLFYIVYFFSLITISEILSETFRFILHNHKNLVEILCNSFDIMFDNCFSTNLYKWLWNSISKRFHTRSFSGCHDDEVHNSGSYRLWLIDYGLFLFCKEKSTEWWIIWQHVEVWVQEYYWVPFVRPYYHSWSLRDLFDLNRFHKMSWVPEEWYQLT